MAALFAVGKNIYTRAFLIKNCKAGSIIFRLFQYFRFWSPKRLIPIWRRYIVMTNKPIWLCIASD